MRLLTAGIAASVFFIVGVLGIVRLTPNGPDWLRLTLGILWFITVYSALALLINKHKRKRKDSLVMLFAGLVLTAMCLVFTVGVESLPISASWQHSLRYVAFLLTALAVWRLFNHISPSRIHSHDDSSSKDRDSTDISMSR